MEFYPKRFFNNLGEPEILFDTNTALWFKFCDEINVVKDSNNKVASVLDSSGNSRTLSQSNNPQKPTWSELGLLFDGIDDTMICSYFSLEQPYIVYIVLTRKSSANSTVMSGYYSTSGMLHMNSTSIWQYNGINGTSVPFAVDSTRCVTALFNTNESFISSDMIFNQYTTSVGVLDPNGFTIGSTESMYWYSNIEVKEVIIRKMSDTEENYNIITGYLKDKYNL